MKKLLGAGLVLAMSLAVAPSARAHCCCPIPCVPMTLTWVEQKVTCYRPVWKEREVTCVVNRLVPREEVIQRKVNVLVPELKDQKVTCEVMTRVPREVEREVQCCRMVSVPVTDPCTGCVYTCCRPEFFTQKVRCVVYDCVPVRRDYIVKVCSYRTEERTVQCKRIVCDTREDKVSYKIRYCEMEAYEAKVKVPVCVPAVSGK